MFNTEGTVILSWGGGWLNPDNMSCDNMIHLTSSHIFIAEGLTHKLKFVHNIVQGKIQETGFSTLF